jgi:hypothetical protein
MLATLPTVKAVLLSPITDYPTSSIAIGSTFLPPNFLGAIKNLLLSFSLAFD